MACFLLELLFSKPTQLSLVSCCQPVLSSEELKRNVLEKQKDIELWTVDGFLSCFVCVVVNYIGMTLESQILPSIEITSDSFVCMFICAFILQFHGVYMYLHRVCTTNAEFYIYVFFFLMCVILAILCIPIWECLVRFHILYPHSNL